MASLVLDQVTKTYPARGKPAVLAVDRLNLTVNDGEIVGLLGSSGCGKTSTLRMIAGFEGVTSGSIRIGERPVHMLLPKDRGVAMAFEGYALYPPLTIRDNIGFALLRERRPRAEIAARVGEIARLLEIEDILDRYPPTISAGQQQRTSLARALIRRAPVSLLDEPMSQLEPQLRAILRARIKDYLIEHKLTTVFVTHDQTEAIALADRIAVMEQGVLQQFATPQALKEEPANLFVASFIGEPPMNILDVRPADGGLAVLGLDGRPAFHVALAAPMTARLAAHARQGGLKLGIRPHRVRVGDPRGLAATVVSNQWLGDQTHLALDLAGCFLVVVAHGHVRSAIGEQVPVGLPLAAMHVFDAESGNALVHGLDTREAAAA
ncbi:ABC transporter ATP-binding protein [Benzoatithermus flavus]|uniref:ABC transporter ATP-binding protein n=1 Tax=Benzoatithermus flavus TaxID=3108223 RepID=A0ABU8XKL6_9PROT